MPVLLFLIFSHSFWIFEFFLRQLFLKFVRRCFGRLDGSIRALRKRRSSNETDNFIESISQMVPRGPRWSPEVPKTDNFLRPVPKPITSCGPKSITPLKASVPGHAFPSSHSLSLSVSLSPSLSLSLSSPWGSHGCIRW